MGRSICAYPKRYLAGLETLPVMLYSRALVWIWRVVLVATCGEPGLGVSVMPHFAWVGAGRPISGLHCALGYAPVSHE